MIADGETGKFDFAFIDADKENYPGYYERCVSLLRSGGVILMDNVRFFGINLLLQAFAHGGNVLRVEEFEEKQETSEKYKMGAAVDQTNRRIFNDDRVFNSLLNVADGLNFVIKK